MASGPGPARGVGNGVGVRSGAGSGHTDYLATGGHYLVLEPWKCVSSHSPGVEEKGCSVESDRIGGQSADRRTPDREARPPGTALAEVASRVRSHWAGGRIHWSCSFRPGAFGAAALAGQDGAARGRAGPFRYLAGMPSSGCTVGVKALSGLCQATSARYPHTPRIPPTKC